MRFENNSSEPWRITFVNTGESTMTGGRLARVRAYLKEDDTFCLTYGDGVSNVDIRRLVEFHETHGKLATVTAVRPPSRFGVLQLNGPEVTSFVEKPAGEQGWINGGFFVLNRDVFDYLGGDEVVWEEEPLSALARDGQLQAFRHDSYWQAMDTLRDQKALSALWVDDAAPWKCWT